MTDPTTGPNDDALDAALRGMPRPAVDPARREAHIAAALAALDTGVADNTADDIPNNVVSLASRRRTRVVTLTAAAAAGLFVVGLGIGRASAPKAESPIAVKNAAPTSATDDSAEARTAVEGCPGLTLDSAGELVTTFGTYALYRTTGNDAATLVVVDTAACGIVTRVAAPASDGG